MNLGSAPSLSFVAMGPKATLKQVPRIIRQYEMVHPVSAQTDAEGFGAQPHHRLRRLRGRARAVLPNLANSPTVHKL